MRYFNRDINWLGFNGKVLDEAANIQNPLYERIRFLSIFSSNLDEFFRVRFPALSSLEPTDENSKVLSEVQHIVRQQLNIFGLILTEELLPQLQSRNISLLYNKPLAIEHLSYASDCFYTKILSFLQPFILSGSGTRFEPENNALYFIVGLTDSLGNSKFAILNIPDKNLSRFIELPAEDNGIQILFIDDVLRQHINSVFPACNISGCYSIKLTRSADIDIADEWSDMFEEEVLMMMQKREHGIASRLLYDAAMPEDYRAFIQQYFKIADTGMVPGGRYHNLKDLANLPNKSEKDLLYAAKPPCRHAELDHSASIFGAISISDKLLHFPYHSYNYVLQFFNEAAIDPAAEEISITLYRIAPDSFITNALISAAKNGKKVIAFVELKARFDESNNLSWAKKMKAAGVHIVYSIPGMKVHAKIGLVKKRTDAGCIYYGLLSTGNFNEQTARFYTDHVLMTCDRKMTREMELLFAYLQARQKPDNYHFLKFECLIVAGFNFTERIRILVEREIENKLQNKDAEITIKVNNLQDPQMIELLYKASNAGVRVNLLIRGICCLIPGIAGMSEHITVRKLVGRYLEHTRIYIFHNNGNEEIYAGSADLMTRNISRRIEVVFPVSDTRLSSQLRRGIQYQLQDNTQTTMLNSNGNLIPLLNNGTLVNAQNAMYDYVCSL